MKTLRLRDTQHLAARNSTAEVTAVISTLRAGRDPGGWLGTPVTRQTGLGAEKALHTQDQRAGVRVTALAATRTGSCHRTGPRNGNTAAPGPSGPRHGARGAAPRRVWVTRPPVWPRPRVTSAPRAQCRARPTQTTAAPGRNGHAPPHAPLGDTSTREIPPHRTAGLLGTAGELRSQPFRGTATRGGRTGTCGLRPRRELRVPPAGSSPPPRLPDTRAACRPPTGERPARQLLVPFTRAGQLCCRCHRIRGTLGRVRLALRQPLRSVAGCRPLGDWVAGSPPASPASPICKSPAPRPPGPPRSSRPSEWRRRRDLCKGFRQRQGRGPEAVSKPTGMGREEDQQRQVEELLFSFEKPNDGKICF